jgi:hypothetical protein
VAQQRQVASKYLISHPINVAVMAVVLAVTGQFLYKDAGDVAVVFTTMVGLSVAGLAAVRWKVGPYVPLAEKLITWNWLDDDTIIATKFGDKIIGALVLGWDSKTSDKRGGRKKKGGKGVVRGWSVLLKYRGKGEGQALLEEAATIVQKRGGDGLEYEQDGICKFRLIVLPVLPILT